MKLFFLVLFFSMPLKAEYLFSYNKSFLLEEEVNGYEYTLQERDGLRAGYKNKAETYLIEHNYYEENSQNGNSQIKNKSKEWLLWYLKEYEIYNWATWIAEYGLALGSQWAEVTTTLAGSSVTITSDRDISIGLSVGARRPILDSLWYGFQARLLYSPAYATEPTIEFSLLQLSIYWK